MTKQKNILTLSLIALVFFLFVLLLVISYNFMTNGRLTFSDDRPTIAVVELIGPIYDSKPIIRQFKKYAEDDAVDAIIFRISSPGGGVSASQEIYEEVRKVRNSGKPILASLGAVAASGGYYAALGATKIMSNPGTVTGSIGVIVGLPNYEGLMNKLGLSYVNITSGPHKDSGSPYRELKEDDREMFQNVVDDLYDQFVKAVSSERNLSEDRVREVADGRIYTGSQAKELGLVDTLGSYEDALQYAVELAGLSGKPKLIKERRKQPTIFDLLFGDIRNALRVLEPIALPEYKLSINF
ncbi:MAG: signal peptide peptidase SppA [Candidatus Marinimicrobia bacterium]|nr:signal peptide peptidase SppA [Candidatus Neomarinimicrobiota bacterium]MCH7955769.1 signal peptide peptidase SppA [Candidatus Neomarinimicrobiota bacterium]